MKCNNCNAELEEGAMVCPSCGEPVQEVTEETVPTEVEETPPMESEETVQQPSGKKKIKVWQLVLVIAACLVLLLSLSTVVYWGIVGVESFDEGVQTIVKMFTPRENNVFYKDSYSVSDEKAAKMSDKVIGTIGDKKMTNGELQVYYWMNVYDFLNNYGYYVIYSGLDYTQPLDEQQCPDEDGTWQQFFLKDALSGWHNYQAMAQMAKEQKLELSDSMQEDLDNLRDTLTSSALEGGFSSIDAMLQADMGPGCTYEDYYSYMETYYYGYSYFSEKYDEFEITDEMLEEYFTEHEAELKESGITKDSGSLYDVRHILVEIDGGTKGEDGKTTYTDAEWEACREDAQKLLDEWLAGEHTEKSFAEMANEHSADTGSNTNGGLYEDLDKDTDFVKEFKDWYLDESRKEGDYGLIKTEYGYHIMYFSGSQAQWLAESREGILSDESARILAEATAKFPMTVNYKNIALGVVDLNTES